MEQSKQAEIELTLDVVQDRLRRRNWFEALALTLPVGVAASAVVVAASRFTLFDFPGAYALVPLLVSVVAAWVISAPRRVTRSEAARFIDSTWRLDQRVSTLIQLDRRRRYTGGESKIIPISLLAEDAWNAIRSGEGKLPAVPELNVARAGYVALALSVGLFLFALFADSRADEMRADFEATRNAIATQLSELDELRADVEALELPENLKASVLAELDQLKAKLNEAGTDRSALLAALGDAQSRIAGLTPERLNQWAEILRAAQALQGMARRSVAWEPPPVDDLTDLGLGANAADSIQRSLDRVTASIQGGMAQELDSLARLVLAKSRTLAEAFEEGSTALFSRDLERAKGAFTAMGEELRRLEKRELSAEAIEKTLSKLEDGKQRLIEDQEPARKTQVGFNRSDRERGGSQPLAGRTASADGNAPPGGQTTPRTQEGQPARGGLPGAGVGDGQTSQQPGESSQGTGGTGDDQGQPRTDAQGTEAGNSTEGQDGPTQANSGEFEAPITGKPGEVTGGLTRVENPTGRGTAQGEEPGSASGDQDRVYVPEAVAGAPGLEGGQQAPDDGSGLSPVLPGVTDDGSGGRGTRTQGGKLTEIRTPYQEVLREYAERATEALEKTYIPPDAKKLVRDYFTQLDR